MTDTEALKAKIENLTPDQIQEIWEVLVGQRTDFYVRVDKILSGRGSGYITDGEIKMVLGVLADEDYVITALAGIGTEGN